ncbi:RagB/SusD family nutrient uptake outer membrane protein [Rapidithrix thailandica]|uniref:RagB/SusD family nutrient uptake outer membrane protein n=1 Tax=Rapidithrix thailandica TaxID=413964 RepID=A0AAW9S6L3_9BACT
MKKIILLVSFISISISQSCNWLDREAQDVLTEEVVWRDKSLALGVLANLYDRLPTGDFDQEVMQRSGEAMWSGSGDGLNRIKEIPLDWFSYWDYGLVRDINLFIENVEKSTFPESDKVHLAAEGRFLRVFVYFELVKRMGGVPLILQSYSYDYSGNMDYLQFPRAKEEEVYDFIQQELSILHQDLPDSPTEKQRATKWAALALQSRAMLYAASLSKYNPQMAIPVTLENGEVGIPSAKSPEYYQRALEAAQQIIESGQYQLHPDFYDLFMRKNGNTEMIFCEDFLLPTKRNWFTFQNSTPSAKEDNDEGGNLTPVLELVEAFDYLNGEAGEVKIRESNGEPVYFDHPEDLFMHKDKRFAATIVYPGLDFRGKTASIQAGLIKWNTATSTYDTLRSDQLGAKDEEGNLLLGWDGPNNNVNITNTGFYLRKFVSDDPGAGQRSTLADNWWPVFRYGEVLLNAAEAAYELNQDGLALEYINQLRERAGFGPGSYSYIDRNLIRKERRIELAFEGHRYYDLRRWRMADQVFDGASHPHALYPFQILHPGAPFHKKYVYVKLTPPRLYESRKFTRENYYSSIPQGALNNNPKLVKNPGH